MIGWINDEGLWLADGDDADRLPVGAAVVMHRDVSGERVVTPLGAQARTELGWAGPVALGDDLDARAEYQVLWPPPRQRFLAAGKPPAFSKAEFERSLRKHLADDPAETAAVPTTDGVGRASCPHGGPAQRTVYRTPTPAIGA